MNPSSVFLRQTCRCLQLRPISRPSLTFQRSFWKSSEEPSPATSPPLPSISGRSIKMDELRTIVAEEHDISKSQAERIIHTFCDTIIEEVADGRPVRLAGFGVFQPTWKPARKYYDFSTKQTKYYGPRKGLKFKPFKAFRKAVLDEDTKSSRGV